MVQRAQEGQQWTCIHGDPNPGNILSPLVRNGKTYVVDRQLFNESLSIWLGVSDVAYMMVHWWEPDIRRALEVPLLTRYHRRLLSLGVRDYPYAKLWEDYRLTAMQSLYVATAWCADPQERTQFKWVWWPQLQQTMAALVDLNVAELLC